MQDGSAAMNSMALPVLKAGAAMLLLVVGLVVAILYLCVAMVFLGLLLLALLTVVAITSPYWWEMDEREEWELENFQKGLQGGRQISFDEWKMKQEQKQNEKSR